MSLGFKRVISSIMAFVMMVSTLVMVNVASVSAADATWDFNSEAWQANSTGKTVYTVDGLSVRHNGASTMNEVNTFKFDKNLREDLTGGYYCQLDLDAGDVVSVDCYYSANNLTNVALRLTQSTDTTTSNGDVKTASASKTQVGTVTFDAVSTTGTYYIVTDTTSTGSTYYASVSKTAGATPTTYTATGSLSGFNGTTFTLSKDGVTYTATVAEGGFTVSSSTPLTAGEYTVQADGYKDATVTLVANGENAFTFGSIAFEAAPTATITVTNSTGTTLENVYYWLNTNSGTARQTAANGVITVADASATSTIYVTARGYKGQAVAVSTGSSTIQLEALPTTAISTGASSITPAIIETALGVTSTASYTNPIIVNADINGFKLSGEFLVQLGFDNSNKAISTDRIQTSAESTIKYTPSSNGTLTINGASSSSNEEAKGRGFTIVGEGLNETVDYNASTSAVDHTYDLIAGTEYTITVVNGGINLYSISFVASADDDSTTTESTTEATTTTATTTTEEPSSEESTEAPVTPGEGYVAVPSTHIMNRTYFGDNITDVESEAGYTLNNLTFKNVADADRDSDIRITDKTTITFKVNAEATVEITFGNNDLAISDGTNSAVYDRHDATVIKVNLYPNVTYTISGATSSNTTLSKLDFTAGHTGADIIGGEEPTEGTTAATTETTTEAAVGDEIAVPISMTGNTSNVTIKINDTDRTFEPNGTVTLNVAEGSTLKFDFDTNVANKIVSWKGFDAETAYNSTDQTFDVTATTDGVQFTYDANAGTEIDDDFAAAGAATPLDYGNYGYGATKGTATGATQAETVAALNSVSGVVTLREYEGGGYGADDARLILNANAETGVKFTAAGDGYLIIDCGRGTPKVTVNASVTTGTKIGGSGKLGYDIKANDVVEIRSGLTVGDNTTSLQLKSVRFQTDGNVFTKVSAGVVDYDSLSSETKEALGDVSAADGKVFARLVGSLDTNTVDADTINKVGFIVIDKATVDNDISTGSNNFMPANYVNQPGAITLEEDEALYDGIYDGNDAVDGEYTLDSSTKYSDGIYYMLRYVALTKGEYYVFPYTVDNAGTTTFDFATATAETDLSGYVFNAQ